MWALDQSCAPRAGRLFADTPLALLAVLALGAATTWALVELGVLAPHAMHVAGVTAGHGALLATAFAWARVRSGSGVVVVALLGLAGSVAALGRFGAFAYLGPPCGSPGWRGAAGLPASASALPCRCAACSPAPSPVHSSRRIFGLGVADARRSRAPGPHAGGARRGRLRRRSQRARGRVLLPRRALQPRPAAMVLHRRRTLATTSYVVRYLVDPLLPKSIELVVAPSSIWRCSRDQLLAPVVVGEPGAGAPERAGLLRAYRTSAPDEPDGGGACGRHGADRARRRRPASLFRHAYLVPVVVAALRFGAPGGRSPPAQPCC